MNQIVNDNKEDNMEMIIKNVIENLELTSNDKPILKLAINDQNLSVDQFVKKMDINIEKIYVDEFWCKIKNKETILLTDKIMRWLSDADEIKHVRENIKMCIENNKIPHEKLKYDEIKDLPVVTDWLNFENDDERFLKLRTFISLCSDHKKCYFFRPIIIYDRKSINLLIIVHDVYNNSLKN